MAPELLSDSRVALPCPETCRCGGDTRIIDSRRNDGYRVRRRECKECRKRWNTYETMVNPRRLRRVTPGEVVARNAPDTEESALTAIMEDLERRLKGGSLKGVDRRAFLVTGPQNTLYVCVIEPPFKAV